MQLKKLAILSLVFALLALSGCLPPVVEDKPEQVEPAATEEVLAESEKPAEKDEHLAQLIQYADENLRTIQVVYPASGVDKTYSGDQIRYGLMDLSGDDKPELVAFVSEDDEIAFFNVYYNDNGNIAEIYNGHPSGFEGGCQGIAFYEDEHYVYHESFSSSTGMEMGLSRFSPAKPIEDGVWNNVYEAKHGLNSETFALEGNLVNGADVSFEEFEAYREGLSASVCLSMKEFYTIDELKDLL